MDGDAPACSCEDYADRICAGLEPVEQNDPAAVSGADLCLLESHALLDLRNNEGLYRQVLEMDLSNVPSSLNPRGAARLGQLEDFGFTVSSAGGTVTFQSEEWVYTLKMLEGRVRYRDQDVLVVQLSDIALEGSYRGASTLAVLPGPQGPHAIGLRQFFTDLGCDEHSRR